MVVIGLPIMGLLGEKAETSLIAELLLVKKEGVNLTYDETLLTPS